MASRQRGLVPNHNGQCKSCHADVVFALDDRGKKQILDPRPVTYLVEKVERLQGGKPNKVDVTRTYPGDDDELVGRALVSHFTTCTEASIHSRRVSAARADVENLLDGLADLVLIPEEPFDLASAAVGDVTPKSRESELVEVAIRVAGRFKMDTSRLERALAASRGR